MQRLYTIIYRTVIKAILPNMLKSKKSLTY